MNMSETDQELLTRYSRQNAEDAFAELVRRHVNMVHSAAFRQVRSAQLAEEIAQSTFLKLARQAGQLAPNTVLTAWLYQVTRREAVDVIRREARRQMREQIATELNAMNATDDVWKQIEPLLDEAMFALDDTDRTAILLRYFDNKSLREVGMTLGASDDAAQKRVSRAIERLRDFFVKRGLTVGAGGLAVVISANAIQAAPIGLGVTIATAAALATNISVSTTVATQTTVTAMKLFSLKTITAIIAVAATTGTAAFLVQQKQVDRLRGENQSLLSQGAELTSERDAALASAAATKTELDRNREDRTELLRLRGEVGLMKKQNADQASKLANLSNVASQTAVAKSAADPEKEAAILRQQVISKLGYSKNWVLAFIKYADQNGGHYPTSFDQATNYLDDNDKEQMLQAANQFEMLYHGLSNAVTDPANTIVLRETQAVPASGGWVKVYAFADGHAEAHRSEDGDFTAWEQTRLPSPASGQ
jgi:RNA polymerase sigma factor (sigma-70 family)